MARSYGTPMFGHPSFDSATFRLILICSLELELSIVALVLGRIFPQARNCSFALILTLIGPLLTQNPFSLICVRSH